MKTQNKVIVGIILSIIVIGWYFISLSKTPSTGAFAPLGYCYSIPRNGNITGDIYVSIFKESHLLNIATFEELEEYSRTHIPNYPNWKAKFYRDNITNINSEIFEKWNTITESEAREKARNYLYEKGIEGNLTNQRYCQIAIWKETQFPSGPGEILPQTPLRKTP